MLIKKNKKGFVQDYLFFIVLLVILAIIIVVGSRLSTDVNEKWQSKTGVSTNSKNIMQDNTNKYYEFFNYIFFTVFFLFMLTLFAGVFLLDTHPFLYWIAVIILGVAMIPTAILSNMYNEFAENPSMATEAARFTFIDAIYNNPLIIFGGVGILVIIFLLAKTR